MTSLARFRTRPNGQRGEVETHTFDPPAGEPRKAKREEFAKVELTRGAARAKAAGIPGAMVLVLLDYMMWKTRSPTFSLSNALLARYGITRYTKYRTLMKLAKAGQIRVEHCNKQSLTVTVLDLPPGVPVA